MLRCVSSYRNAALGLFLDPGVVLRDLTPEQEAFLLRDSPGSFVAYEEATVPIEGPRPPDAPPQHTMLERERAVRKVSERGRGEVMTRATHSALVRPKE